MKKVIIINNENFGQGDDILGGKLMGTFLRKLWAKEKKPDSIIFYNSAVKLMIKDSLVLDALHGLFEAGVDLIACGTCVDSYKIKESFVVGRISGMDEIVHILMDKSVSTITV